MNTQITEDYVSFEVAKLLKEKGFDADITTYRDDFIQHGNIVISLKECLSEDKIKTPTLQMTMKWLKEVHNVFISISIMYIDNKLTYLWIPCVIKEGNIDYPIMEEYMADSYKEACEAAIKYCLTNLI